MFWRGTRTPVKAPPSVRRRAHRPGERAPGQPDQAPGPDDPVDPSQMRSGWQGYIALGVLGFLGYMIHAYWDVIFS